MKKWVKILLIVIAVLIALTAGLAIWQWNNIIAILTTVTKTEIEIAAELDSSKEKLESEIKEKFDANLVSDFTSEEERLIIKGEISAEDAVKMLEEKRSETQTNKKTHPEDNKNKDEIVEQLIGDKVIELYSMKAFYLGKLGQIEAKVRKEYAQLPKEKKNLIGKKDLATKYMGTATSLLKQCDTEVGKLIADLEKELKKFKADTSIIKTIKDAYENEKALKKAYYLKLLGE
ncbi:MAG: hypothetical protein IJE62_07990 [Clostridia bacterium]|nr:hypothetical protein [Clostridia bacterium]